MVGAVVLAVTILIIDQWVQDGRTLLLLLARGRIVHQIGIGHDRLTRRSLSAVPEMRTEHCDYLIVLRSKARWQKGRCITCGCLL